MLLVDLTTGKTLASEVKLAGTIWQMFFGLMFKGGFPAGRALLFKLPKPGKYSIHTFFVAVPIDLIYLDSGFTVVELRAHLKPWRIHRPESIANYIIELPVGSIARAGAEIGHKLAMREGTDV